MIKCIYTIKEISIYFSYFAQDKENNSFYVAHI